MPRPGQWQRPLNTVPGPKPPEQQGERWIHVRVRIVWDVDGETWIDGTAIGWTQDVVAVLVGDHRSMGPEVRVAPSDVVRR